MSFPATPVVGGFTADDILNEANRILADQRSIITLDDFISVHGNALIFMTTTHTIAIVILSGNFSTNPFVAGIHSILRVKDRHKEYVFCPSTGLPRVNCLTLYHSVTAPCMFRSKADSAALFPDFDYSSLSTSGLREVRPFYRTSRFNGASGVGSGASRRSQHHPFSLGALRTR